MNPNPEKWIQQQGTDAMLSVRVVPRATQPGVQGLLGDALKIRLASPPVDGKANRALIRFLAETLNLPKSAVRLESGRSGRSKRIRLCGMNAAQAAQQLLPDPAQE